MPLPVGLPEEMTSSRAGAFVSLHKYGRLRGCIGTIMATQDSVALEIIRNAVSAAVHDNRFEPVTADELPFLTYKVDILSPPEPIGGMDELDVERYGVIVSSSGRRGLLLPNLDGVDTVEQQVAIARQKGGIREDEAFTLERFEVVRHE
jgi:AmmeMemoRadiSam system protein A